MVKNRGVENASKLQGHQYSSLCLKPYRVNRISTCTTAKEIWDKLKITHEGTSQVKESNIAFLSNKYEMFKMHQMRTSHLGLTNTQQLLIAQQTWKSYSRR